MGLDETDNSTLEQYFCTSKEKQQLIKQLLALAYNNDAINDQNLPLFTVQQGERLLANIKVTNTAKTVNVDDYIRLN